MLKLLCLKYKVYVFMCVRCILIEIVVTFMCKLFKQTLITIEQCHYYDVALNKYIVGYMWNKCVNL
jgi:hypothetical protein